MRQKKMGIIMP
ncbi:hypothetical protein E2C01_061210 [Portunus trituberculatus]|uniref:Uncharacterized protein n=1 Tax=Portunus trituberculatus TaxID=210409 RepID=A0A5B7HDS2_PORTR|nr:hypothetical protein [Portunus trituberculatus]